MAYQSTYGPRPMYNPGTTAQPSNAPHLPHQLPHQQPHQQQQPYYPNAYPHTTAPSPTYPPSAHGPDGQMSQIGPRQQHQQHQYPPIQNNGNGRGALMQPRTAAPDDPFKKPYLPPQKTDLAPQTQQHYSHTAQSPQNSYPYNQSQPSSTASSVPTATAYPPPQRPTKQPLDTSESHPAPSSMTVSAPPANSSAQSTPTSEAPSKPADPASQASKLSPLDQERADSLLTMNNLLLQASQALQKAGLMNPQLSGNPQSPQHANPANALPQSKSDGATASPNATDPSAPATANPSTVSPTTTPTTTTPTATTTSQQSSQNSRKFVEYMRRVKSNIQFLAGMSSSAKQRQWPPYPMYLEPLPDWLADSTKEEDKSHLDALNEQYGKLRELFPDWRPQQPQTQAQGLGQQQQQQQGAQLSQVQSQSRP